MEARPGKAEKEGGQAQTAKAEAKAWLPRLPPIARSPLPTAKYPAREDKKVTAESHAGHLLLPLSFSALPPLTKASHGLWSVTNISKRSGWETGVLISQAPLGGVTAPVRQWSSTHLTLPLGAGESDLLLPLQI